MSDSHQRDAETAAADPPLPDVCPVLRERDQRTIAPTPWQCAIRYGRNLDFERTQKALWAVSLKGFW